MNEIVEIRIRTHNWGQPIYFSVLSDKSKSSKRYYLLEWELPDSKGLISKPFLKNQIDHALASLILTLKFMGYKWRVRDDRINQEELKI